MKYLTNEELVKEYQNGNLSMLEVLIKKNENLVKYFANKYSGVAKKASLEFNDLVQEGWIAFLDAVEKYQYNDDEPVLFSTYAGMRIRYRILNTLNSSICRKKKRDVTSEEINICSISEAMHGTDDMTIEETLSDEQSEEVFMMVEDEIDNKILRQDLFHVIETVLGKGAGLVRNVLIMHYGLKGKERTFEQIGKIFKVTWQSVQQAEFAAIKKIRNSQEGKELMKKYQWQVLNSFEHNRDKINQFASPDVVLERMETLDELLYGVLKQIC